MLKVLPCSGGSDDSDNIRGTIQNSEFFPRQDGNRESGRGGNLLDMLSHIV